MFDENEISLIIQKIKQNIESTVEDYKGRVGLEAQMCRSTDVERKVQMHSPIT